MTSKNTKLINHCSHCLYESECAYNNWTLYGELDPCCPNMKKGREQYKQFLEEFFNNKLY